MESDTAQETPTPRRHQLTTVDTDYYFDAVASQNNLETADEFILPIYQNEKILTDVELTENDLLANFVEEKLIRPLTLDENDYDYDEEEEEFPDIDESVKLVLPPKQNENDEEEVLLLDEFFDVADESALKTENKGNEEEITSARSATQCLLSTIHEVPTSSSNKLICTTSCDSDTLLVVFTSDGHTTGPSSGECLAQGGTIFKSVHSKIIYKSVHSGIIFKSVHSGGHFQKCPQ